MADAIRLSSSLIHSLRFSSPSLLTTFHLASNSPHLSLVPINQNLDKIIPIGPARLACTPRKPLLSFKDGGVNRVPTLQVRATVNETEQPKWWERNSGPNMIDIHSTQEFLDALSQAGDRLVIVEFYGTWCASCRALFPKLCRTAQEHPDISVLKVNFDENKPMCKSLNVKVLPYFHFYRGADGQLESFSCSLAKFQRIKDAIEMHNTARCSIGPPRGVGDLKLEPVSAPKKD